MKICRRETFNAALRLFKAEWNDETNLEVFGKLCKDHLVADVVAILGSIDIVLGEVDR